MTPWSVAEIAVLADRAGVSRAGLMEFLNESAIGSVFTRYKTANVVELEFPPTFTPVGQRKDVRLALDLARELEVPMPVLNTTEVAFSRLVSGGLGEGREARAFQLRMLAAGADAQHAVLLREAVEARDLAQVDPVLALDAAAVAQHDEVGAAGEEVGVGAEARLEREGLVEARGLVKLHCFIHFLGREDSTTGRDCSMLAGSAHTGYKGTPGEGSPSRWIC